MRENYTPWTMQELDTLQRCYPYMTVSALQEMLPGRKPRSIYAKANAIGVKAYSRTVDNFEYIRINLGRKSYVQMAEELGVSKQLIAYRVRRLRSLLN